MTVGAEPSIAVLGLFEGLGEGEEVVFLKGDSDTGMERCNDDVAPIEGILGPDTNTGAELDAIVEEKAQSIVFPLKLTSPWIGTGVDYRLDDTISTASTVSVVRSTTEAEGKDVAVVLAAETDEERARVAKVTSSSRLISRMRIGRDV